MKKLVLTIQYTFSFMTIFYNMLINFKMLYSNKEIGLFEKKMWDRD